MNVKFRGLQAFRLLVLLAVCFVTPLLIMGACSGNTPAPGAAGGSSGGSQDTGAGGGSSGTGSGFGAGNGSGAGGGSSGTGGGPGTGSGSGAGSGPGTGSGPGAWRTISAEEAKQIMSEGDYILLDVRTEDEYREAHIEGAVLIPYDELELRAEAELLDKDATILIYCRSGRRSAIAAETLANMGYTGVCDFGGIANWPYGVEK